MIPRRRFAVLAVASTFVPPLIGRAALAQAWPTQYVRFIVPFPAGTAADIGCRLIAARLSEIWGHQAVVENTRRWWQPRHGSRRAFRLKRLYRADGRVHACGECLSLPIRWL
jgi:hypothetical protein